jgi:hypothetical protein
MLRPWRWQPIAAAVVALSVAACPTGEARSLAEEASIRPAAPLSAALSVREPEGVARREWPVAGGVPFPKGQVRDPAGIALAGANGSPVPLQTSALSRWDDGSVRWALLQFPVTVDANGRQTFAVATSGRATVPAAAVRVDERPNEIEVQTGAIRFTIPRDRFELLRDVRLADRTVLAGPVRTRLVAGEGTSPATVPTPSAVTIRERGPLRAAIEWRGAFGGGFDYGARLYAYAGQPFVRVLLTFVATGSGDFAPLRNLSVEVPLPSMTHYRMHAGGGERAEAIPKKGVSLLQDDAAAVRVDGQPTSGRAAGWIEAHGARIGVALAARYFWQEFPKAFHLTGNLLRYELYPADVPPAQIGVGAAKTHEFVLSFFDPAAPHPPAAMLAEPLVVEIDPTWIASTRALPDAIARNPGTAAFLDRLEPAFRTVERRTAEEVWDEAARVTCPPPGQERRRTGAFGMLNWGDWNYPGFHDTTKGCDAWGNLEYDLAHVTALAFAATGGTGFHRATIIAARHFMDVDTIHADPTRPKWIGMNHPKNPLHFSFARGGVDLGHTWTEGLIAYYWLTGDERGLEAARGIAEYLVRRFDAGIARGNPRQWGWPAIALIAAYEATGEARYRDYAATYARRGMQTYRPTPATDWKLGILADAIAQVHAATHDAEMEQWLRRYAAAIAAKPDADIRCYAAVAYVASFTGDAKLVAATRRAIDEIEFGSWAKPFTIAGRAGFRILSLLPSPQSPLTTSPH